MFIPEESLARSDRNQSANWFIFLSNLLITASVFGVR